MDKLSTRGSNFKGFTILKVWKDKDGNIIDKRTWVYGSLVYNNGMPFRSQMYIQDEDNPATHHLVERISVGECIGKRDKNGKMLYENDFVKYFGGIGRIVYSNQHCGFRIYENVFSLQPILDDCVYKGCVFENPELLIEE